MSHGDDYMRVIDIPTTRSKYKCARLSCLHIIFCDDTYWGLAVPLGPSVRVVVALAHFRSTLRALPSPGQILRQPRHLLTLVRPLLIRRRARQKPITGRIPTWPATLKNKIETHHVTHVQHAVRSAVTWFVGRYLNSDASTADESTAVLLSSSLIFSSL